MRTKLLCEPEAEKLVGGLVPCEDKSLRSLPGAQVVKHGKTRLVVRIPDPRDPQSALYVKRYLSKTHTWRRRVGNLLRSRALYEYRQMLRSHACGIDIPQALGAAELSQWGVWRKGFVVMSEVPQCRKISDLAGQSRLQLAPGERGRIRRLAAQSLAKAHCAGMIHDDLGAYNLLLSGEGESCRIYFIDMANALFVRKARLWHRVKNLAQLHRSVPAQDMTLRERLRFLAEYGRAAGVGKPMLKAMAPLIGSLAELKSSKQVSFAVRLKFRFRCYRTLLGLRKG